jgi:hypothetical protein
MLSTAAPLVGLASRQACRRRSTGITRSPSVSSIASTACCTGPGKRKLKPPAALTAEESQLEHQNPLGRADQPVRCNTSSHAGRLACRAGGYLSRHSKTQVTLRDRLFVSLVLGWQSSRLPTDYVGMAKISCRARGHDHVCGTGHYLKRGDAYSGLLYKPQSRLWRPKIWDCFWGGSPRYGGESILARLCDALIHAARPTAEGP